MYVTFWSKIADICVLLIIQRSLFVGLCASQGIVFVLLKLPDLDKPVMHGEFCLHTSCAPAGEVA